MRPEPTVSDPSSLVLHVEGAPGRADRVLRMERLPGGRVRVREWAGDGGELGARDVDASDLLAEIERYHAERRRLGVEMYEVRRWLAAR